MMELNHLSRAHLSMNLSGHQEFAGGWYRGAYGSGSGGFRLAGVFFISVLEGGVEVMGFYRRQRERGRGVTNVKWRERIR